MNPKSYRILTDTGSGRVRCPVCHEAVYSRAGIHPQCAVRQSEPPKPKNKPQMPPSLAEPEATTVEGAGTDVVADSPIAEVVSASDHVPV
jgi:hypothetical protein